jgi:hypothetical protein
MDHALEQFVENVHFIYGSLPGIGTAIVAVAVLVAVAIKLGTDDQDWKAPLVIGSSVAAAVTLLFVVLALPTAKTYCKHLWKESQQMQPGAAPHFEFSAYASDNCFVIIDCTRTSSNC